MASVLVLPSAQRRCEILAGRGVVGEASDHDPPQGAVGLTVTGAAEAMSLLFAAGRVEWCCAAEPSEGSFVADPARVLAGGDEERAGGVGADPDSFDHLGCGLRDERCEQIVEVPDLVVEFQDASGEGLERDTIRVGDVGAARGPEPRGCAQQLRDRQPAELAAELVGRGGDERSHLVQRPGPVPGGAGASQSQHPDRFDIAVAGLRLAERVTRERGPGRADRVVRVGLPGPASPLPVRSIDLHHRHPRALEMTSQSRAVTAGPFDTDQHDLTERTRATRRARDSRPVSSRTTPFPTTPP